jgi:hypothetical protein
VVHDLRWAQHTFDSLAAIVQPEIFELRAAGVAQHSIDALYPVEPLAYSALLLDLFADSEELNATLDRFKGTDNYNFPGPFDLLSVPGIPEAISEIEKRVGPSRHRPSAPYALLALPRSLQQLLLHPELVDEARRYGGGLLDNPLPVFEEVCKTIDRLLGAQQKVRA